MGYFFYEPKPIKASTFDQLSETMLATFEQERFNDLQVAAREMRENVLDLASPVMRRTEQHIAERVRSRRRTGPDRAIRSSEEEQALIDLSVAREIARVDMGIDLLVAQPP